MPLDESDGVEFDEAWYLFKYPDVAKAVHSGIWPSGKIHFLTHGQDEGRAGFPEPARVYAYAQVAVASEILLPGTTPILPASLRYSNIERYSPVFGSHLRNSVYAGRQANVSDMSLYKLPAETAVYCGSDFLTACGGSVISEQVPPSLAGNANAISHAIGSDRPNIGITEECLLVARYGVGTWGHWMGDLLPKIVIAETFFPGRFTYVLPDWIVAAERWVESLAAYEIPIDRIRALDRSVDYSFSNLFAMSSIQSDHIFHPGAMDLMSRRIVCAREDPPLSKLALMRTDTTKRRIANLPEIAEFLRADGYEFHEPSAMPFIEQVRLFRRSQSVVGVLGSGLTGLMYSPHGVQVSSFAPPEWGDRFFYAMIQNRNGKYADIRGPITAISERNSVRDSEFRIEISDLIEALRLMAAAA